MLAEAKSETLRQEYRADLTENNIRALNREVESQVMEIGFNHTRHEQSKREQGLPHEELTDRRRALRDTRFWSIHEMEELKRAHELRVDEFSRGKLIKNQNTCS